MVDLFAGTRSISKVFKNRGHETYSIEWDKSHSNINWYVDISKVNVQDILERFGVPDVIWVSCPCEKFSVAAPRGSQTGTQGLKGAKERSIIPSQLCEHIANICEENII